MSVTDFAGIYIERHRARAIVARTEVEWGTKNGFPWVPDHEFTHLAEVDCDEKTDPEAVLAELVQEIAANSTNLGAVGVACFGPFVSLDATIKVSPGNPEQFGVLDQETADAPFAGVDLYSSIQTALSEHGLNDTLIDIQTDAVAGALAEGYFRRIESNETLLYITLTDGIGGGLVRGLTPIQSAYHAEMGLVPIHLIDGDEHFLNDDKILFGPSVGDVLRLEQMLRRARRFDPDIETRQQLVDFHERDLWRPPASYVAQLCVACIGIAAPHCIVIGGYLARAPGLISDIRAEVKRLMHSRPGMRWPERTSIRQFIQSSLVPKGADGDPCLAGALYVAMLVRLSDVSACGSK